MSQIAEYGAPNRHPSATAALICVRVLARPVPSATVAEAITRLRALSDPNPAGGSLVEVGLFCLDGRLEVGDRLVIASDPDGTEHAIRGEVLEIRFFDQMIDGLDPGFSANALCSGDLGPLRQNWELVASRP